MLAVGSYDPERPSEWCHSPHTETDDGCLSPCNISVISIPLPTPRLALAALRALRVDEELSPLVRRSFAVEEDGSGPTEGKTVLRTDYNATTNRMLRVAVNGFMESLGVVLGVLEELDVDVLDGPEMIEAPACEG